MRRNVTWLLSTISVVVLMFGYHTSTSGALATATTQAPVSSTSGASTSAGSAGSGSGSGGSDDDTGNASGSSSSSTVTGSTVDTQWGPVQVQLTTQSAKITDVQVLQYPGGNPKDEEINAHALPILIQETLDSQGASVDMVSGATVTSAGYTQSLQSALDKAGL